MANLGYFDCIATPRRKIVKYIWLRIELQEYECPDCQSPETDLETKINLDIITTTLTNAFRTLSIWNSVQDLTLTLDITVHSPSDSQHDFNDLHFGSDLVTDLEVPRGIPDVESHVTQTTLPLWARCGSIYRLLKHVEIEPEFGQILQK
jgi:hypothetical protein